MYIVSLFQENVGRLKKAINDFTSMNQWVVRDYYRLVNSVNEFEPLIQGLSDEQVVPLIMNMVIVVYFPLISNDFFPLQLTAKTEEFRRRLKLGDTLADIQAGISF